MKDRYFHKKKKVADLLFDLVKYLLTALGAVLLFSEKSLSLNMVIVVTIIILGVFIFAVFITPLKED